MAIHRHVLTPRPEGPAAAAGALDVRERSGGGPVREVAAAVRRAPELIGLVALAAVLNLWSLGQNGWANTYYSAAVRSMASSWHAFLFASLDASGVQTVDKPPLSLWVQALSVRVFGLHPLAILIPEALMGIACVVLVYDLVRRRFGRLGGTVAGVALATTPIVVAMSRHNNPDELLTLLCTAAVWFAVRAFEDGRTRWLVLSGLAVGLGFETKMGVALVVVPAIALTYLWLAPRGRLLALRQLLAGGGAMLAAGGAWPLLVALTPASSRPWISGTSDNSILSLIFGYNGFGRVDGQLGGPAGARGGAGGIFAGATGPFRLFDSSLGGQAGWLIALAVVAAIGILVATRVRRRDPRTAWVMAVGLSFLATAVLFSIAQGIFHPYYVVLLAPFTAALVGAGVATAVRGGVGGPLLGTAALAAGVVGELVVIGDYPGQLHWLEIALPAACGVAAISLFVAQSRRGHTAALALGVAALLIAPTAWAFDTLGYRTQGTFPSGGPATLSSAFGGPGARGVGGGFRRFAAGRTNPASGSAGGVPLFGNGNAGGPPTGARGFAGGGGLPTFGSGGPPTGRGGFGGAPGGFGGESVPSAALTYTAAHGGGTIAISSQSEAATAILAGDARVAGIGGFTGAESDPSVAWLAGEVAEGKIRWVYTAGGVSSAGFGGRSGATSALDAAAKACTPADTRAVTGLYDCSGRVAALRALS